jgi:hypothetical protein
MVNIDELEKVLLVNWTKFIDPKKIMSLILLIVRDSNLPCIKDKSNKKSIQITLSQFRPAKNGNYTIWVDFIIPKKEGIAIGTCELILNLYDKEINHVQTIGSIFSY